MEKSRRIKKLIIENSKLSKTQEKKRRRRKYPNVFFKKEITQVFDEINNPRTMVASFLTFFCALRISEVCNLQWRDIDLDECRLKIVDGKNHKDAFIPISPIVMPILRKWREIAVGEKYFLPSEKYRSEHYKDSSLLKDYKKALKRAGLHIPTEKNSAGRQQHQYKFHTLRHTRCTNLLSNGVPVEKVQKFMRHDDLETTMGYTWILDKEMNKAVEQADIGTFEEETQVSGQIIMPKPKISPLEIAQKRLACGELTVREYTKISKALTGTNMF